MNWSAETEKAVVGKARAGDLSAFGLLYDNYSQNVYSRCLRFTKDPDTAEDLRQDVFIQAWKKCLISEAIPDLVPGSIG